MGIRTPGLTGAIRALYQLSYIPAFFANYNPLSKKASSQEMGSHFASFFVSNKTDARNLSNSLAIFLLCGGSNTLCRKLVAIC